MHLVIRDSNDLEGTDEYPTFKRCTLLSVTPKLKIQKNLEAPGRKHKKKNDEPVSNEPVELTEEENDKLLNIMLENLHCSALKEHIDGRHDVLETVSNNSTCDLSKVQAIFKNQVSSNFLKKLEQAKVKPIKECCQKIVSGLNGNVVEICIKTMEFHSTWIEERQLRITGNCDDLKFCGFCLSLPNYQ
ncbi:hypothetical protein KQX54_014508 [Cotesia glomerata]|uniref:Uncharacterized protein n=1 Tax=Cotesia glomerata TaxID=32391 RepID=A0AAV7HWN3_COTGL|nr:hypothetical protein KQX54_014508 [Cotesia glomerata]